MRNPGIFAKVGAGCVRCEAGMLLSRTGLGFGWRGKQAGMLEDRASRWGVLGFMLQVDGGGIGVLNIGCHNQCVSNT